MASRMFQEATKEPTLVGIIGCGRMGSHIAHCLLTFGEFTPEEIKISTRRPETLSTFNKSTLKSFSESRRCEVFLQKLNVNHKKSYMHLSLSLQTSTVHISICLS